MYNIAPILLTESFNIIKIVSCLINPTIHSDINSLEKYFVSNIYKILTILILVEINQ
jgi:hypothetical protein